MSIASLDKKLAIFFSLGILITGLVSSATVKSNSEWLSGNFDGTTADKPAQSNLSLGYPNGTPEDSLKGFWRFDNDFTDYSGNQVQLLDTRGMGFSQGVFDTNSAQFVSSNNPYVEYEDRPGFRENNFTLATWVKINSNGQDMPIIEKSVGRSKGFLFLVDNYYNSDKLSLYLQSSADNVQRFRTDEALPDGEWIHLAATYDSSDVSLYINGEEKVLVDEGQSAATYRPSTQELIVGASSTRKGGDYFNGLIDELKVFTPYLNSTEIKNQYLNGKPFRGSYVSQKFSYDQPRKWEYVKTSSNVSQDTNANITFQVSDDGFSTIKDSESVNLQGGRELHQLDIQDASEARILVKGSTTNVTETWVVESVEAEYFRDFEVNSISINESEPVEGRSLGINVNVSNNEPDFAEANVRLVAEKYRNDTGWEPVEMEEQTFSSNGFDSSILRYDIIPDQGPHRVKVTADPLDKFNETNESNNKNSNSFDVPLYGTFYGNTETTVTLEEFNKGVFYNFTEKDEDGTIYYVDSDASFSFNNLKPLQDYGDLETVDQALNSEGFNDSVATEWSEGSSIRRTECFWVSGSDLCNVPVSNSTKNSFFDTGITYDGGATYSTDDPLVFLTDMVNSKEGSYGEYDYEVKIPSTLSNTQGSSEKLDVYMEIE